MYQIGTSTARLKYFIAQKIIYGKSFLTKKLLPGRKIWQPQ